MDNFQEIITQTLINAPSGVHAVLFGPKTRNNEIVDNESFVFFVEQKRPLSELKPDEVIPKRLDVDGKYFFTDVVQNKKFKPHQCYSLSDANVLYLQSRIRPLSGGLEISSLNTWSANTYGYNYSYGTMGFLAVDNTDNTLVGVTNNHVIVSDAFIGSDQDPSDQPSSIIDNVKLFNQNYTNRILQFGSAGGVVNFQNDNIGIPKRFVPLSLENRNIVDGALFTINTGVVDSNSSSQALLNNSFAMPFCTTSEVNSLSTNSYPIYSVGRSTGPKGTSCPLVVYGYGSIYIDYPLQDVWNTVIFSNSLFYRFLDESNLPIYPGDSGSAIIANINGTLKIAGLVYAGDGNDDPDNPESSLGVACRIDDVAQQLNISAWNGYNANFIGNTPKILTLIRPHTDTRTSIVSGGKTFYYAGTVNTNLPNSNI